MTPVHIVDEMYLEAPRTPILTQMCVLPTPTETSLTEATSTQLCHPQCVEWTRHKMEEGGFGTLPRIPSPNYLSNNAPPARGCAVLFTYNHSAFIEGVFPGGMWISESNLDGKCSVTERFVPWNSEFIKGFWCSP